MIGAQCSGTLILAKLGLVRNTPVCTDLITSPWVKETGATVIEQPFYAKDNMPTAGGCLASQYLAAWIIVKTKGIEALGYVVPVGERNEYISRAISNISPYL